MVASWYQSIDVHDLPVRHEKIPPGYDNAVLGSGSLHAVQTRK